MFMPYVVVVGKERRAATEPESVMLPPFGSTTFERIMPFDVKSFFATIYLKTDDVLVLDAAS